MRYLDKQFVKSLFIFALFLLPITKATSNDLPQQVNQLQSQMMEANEKITALTSDQQKSAITISTLQTRLATAHQEISDLNNNGGFKPNQLDTVHRTANGHGRGGR